MKQKYSVQLSFGSLVYLVGSVGFLGGFIVGLFASAYALYTRSWLEALLSPIVGALLYGFTFVVVAAIAFPIYRRVMSRGTAAELSGSFRELPFTSWIRPCQRHASYTPRGIGGRLRRWRTASTSCWAWRLGAGCTSIGKTFLRSRFCKPPRKEHPSGNALLRRSFSQ